MNLLLLKMGPRCYRGGGGGGGGGGDGGDSGDSSGIGDGIGPSAGPGAGPGAPGTGPSSNGDVGQGNDSPGADGVDSDVANTVADMAVNPGVTSSSNGIAGMMGIDNPTIAAAINGILGNAISGVVGIPGVVGMANAAINNNSSQAASTMGSVIGGMMAGPAGAAIGGIAGNAIGNAPGVPSSSVPGDPSGGGSREWTASPTPIPDSQRGPGLQAISGGLGMGSTGNAKVAGLGAISGVSNPGALAPVKRAGDVEADNPLLAALRGGTPTAYRP